MTSIEFKDLSFDYTKDERVLHDINIAINRPGLVCIIGPNGVGKSTLVKCVNKLLNPTEGEVILDDKSTTDYTLKDIAKKVGFVPATSSDMFAMNVVDTVLMGRQPHERLYSRHENLRIVAQVLKDLEISHLAFRRFDELSAGQHQKVMIARGLAQEPNVLILDEPTANLDVRHQMQVVSLLRDIAMRREMTIIMISHDLNISARFADEMIVLAEPGVLYAVGTPEEVITEDMMRYVYGMETKIEHIRGHPHVLLLDPISESEYSKLHSGDSPNEEKDA